MPQERRWFVKFTSPTGPMHMVLRGEEFLWTREGADIYKIIYKHEIPPAFWHLSISDYIAYFDHGIKPILSYRRPE